MNEVLVYSERVKPNKADHILPINDTMLKAARSSNDSRSKIRVIDNFEARTETQNHLQDSLIRSVIVPPLSDLSRSLV